MFKKSLGETLGVSEEDIINHEFLKQRVYKFENQNEFLQTMRPTSQTELVKTMRQVI